MEKKYYKCEVCGKIIEVIYPKSVPTVCCDMEMKELKPCSTDGATEKHVPDVKIDGDTVTVCIGEKDHPMEDSHYIEWVSIETKQGSQCKSLKPGCKPKVCFKLTDDDEFVAAYAYCNIHDLWKK